jgi:hypothetical protein
MGRSRKPFSSLTGDWRGRSLRGYFPDVVRKRAEFVIGDIGELGHGAREASAVADDLREGAEVEQDR